MQMKTIFLTLCIGLVLLAGCGRSKPQTSKTAGVDTSALENTAPPPPPDQLPPKSTAAPVSRPAAVPPNPGAPSFAALSPVKDHAAETERQKFAEAVAKQQQNAQRQELEQKRREWLQTQPQSDNGQTQ